VEPASVSSTPEQNLLLNLLTTPKFRALSAMYIIFRLLDNLSFLIIIVLSIENRQWTLPTPRDFALFSAIGLEIFYDVMLQVNKYWILERLSLYIGIIMYVIYATIIACKYAREDYSAEQLQLLISVVAIRFVAFILEECVDVAIDGELHNELLNLKPADVELGQLETDEATSLREGKFETYWNLRSITMPPGVVFKGSFFAWSAYSVFDDDVWGTKQFPAWLFWTLCLIPFVVAVILIVILGTVCFFASLLPLVLTLLFGYLCCGTCSPTKILASNFFKELTRF